MSRTLLPAFMLSCIAMLIAACAGSGRPPLVNDHGERVYIDDQTLEAMDEDLKALSAAVRLGDESAENAMRAKLADSARTYQKALLSALYDTSSTPRRAVAGVMLGFTGDAAVIPALLEKASDEREAESVRLNSSLGLSALGDRLRDYHDTGSLMSTLVANMEDTSMSPAFRRAAIDAFAEAYGLTDDQSIMPLRNRMMIDPDGRVKVAAINAMGRIGNNAVVSDLTVVGLQNPEVAIRVASAIALGKLTDSSNIIPALERSCRDDNVLVRRHSIDALARHYSHDPDRIYHTVVAGLSDFDDRVREASALALARMRDERGITPLLQATGDRTAVVREAAARSVGSILPAEREKEAYPLVDLISDSHPGVQNAAITSLAAITSTDFGNSQTQWRRYFYTKYPDLDPARMYEGKPKPRISSGIGTRRAPQTTQRQPARQPQRPQQQQQRPPQRR
jgi:HEAT repeat protein